jgi:hypothetical protein
MIQPRDSIRIPGGSNGGTSDAIDTTGATLLAVCTSLFGTDNPPTDSYNNEWVEGILESSSVESTFGLAIYYCLNPTVGPGHTFSISSQFSSGSALAFSGVRQLGTPQMSGVNNGVTASIQPGAIAPPENGALFIAAISEASNPVDNSVAVDSDFVLVDQQPYDGAKACFGSASAYFIQNGAAPVNPTFTWTPGLFEETSNAAMLQFDATPASEGGGSYLGRVRVVGSAPSGAKNPFVGSVSVVDSAPDGAADPYLGQIVEVVSVPSGSKNTQLGNVTIVDSAPAGSADPFLGSIKSN